MSENFRLVVAMALVASLGLAACKGGDGERPKARPGHIEMTAGFDIPHCSDPVRRSDGVHYVTRRYGSPLTGSMRLAWRIDGDGVFAATEGGTPLLTLYFQRSGDDWTARGEYASYRWYSRARLPVASGAFEMSAPYEFGKWGPVVSAGNNALKFELARQKVARVGFVLGSPGGAGHGVCMVSGSARLTILAFEASH